MPAAQTSAAGSRTEVTDIVAEDGSPTRQLPPESAGVRDVAPVATLIVATSTVAVTAPAGIVTEAGMGL